MKYKKLQQSKTRCLIMRYFLLISTLIMAFALNASASNIPPRRLFGCEQRNGDTRPKPDLTTPPSPVGKGELKVIRSKAPGWQPNGIVVCDTANCFLPKIVPDGNNGAIICWTESYRGADSMNHYSDDIYAQRVDSGGNFVWQSQGVPVCSLSGSWSSYPAMISDGKGGAIIAWEDDRDGLGYTRVFAQRLDSLGNRVWPENGVLVCNQMSGYVDLCSDGHGGAIITYVDGRDEANTSDNIYAQRVDSAGNPAWTIDGVPVCTADSIQFWPAIVNISYGGAIITWHDTRNGNYDIYVQKINDLGNTSWQINGTPVCTTATINEQYPSIVTDGSDGCILGWTTGHIYAQKVDSAGNKPWAINGILVCSKSGSQTRPSIIADGMCGAIFCWGDSDTNRYVQRIDINGSLMWSTNGVNIGRGGRYDIISDNASGGIVIFDSKRNDPYYADQYVQKIDSAGNILWNPIGVPVCTLQVASESYPHITIDGLSGAVCTWFGYYPGSRYPIYTDIIAQRVYTNGTPGGVTSIQRDYKQPNDIKLSAYPNPFQDHLNVIYTLPNTTKINLSVTNILGQGVKTVYLGVQHAGKHAVTWDGKDNSGKLVSTGVYICTLAVSGHYFHRKLIIIR